jgi:hypothetical protein
MCVNGKCWLSVETSQKSVPSIQVFLVAIEEYKKPNQKVGLFKYNGKVDLQWLLKLTNMTTFKRKQNFSFHFFKEKNADSSILLQSIYNGLQLNKSRPIKLPLNLKNSNDLNRNLRYFGKNRGLQGNKNSCWLDSLLMSMFAFTSVFDFLLYRPKRDYDFKKFVEIQMSLKVGIVEKLRK